MPFYFCYYMLANSEKTFRSWADLLRLCLLALDAAIGHGTAGASECDAEDNFADAILLAMSKPRLTPREGGKSERVYH
jgi:hypothetical protein